MRFLDNRRDGILSLADARRDANLARRGARDQYESDVADFIDNEVTYIENSFMSGGDSNDIPLNIQSPMRIDEFPPDMFDEPIFDEPIYVPPIDFIDESLPMPPPVIADPPPVLDDPIPDIFDRPPISRPPDELFISRLDDDDLLGDILPPIVRPPKPPSIGNVYDDVFTPPPMVNPIIDDGIPPFIGGPENPIIDLPIISPPPFDGIPPFIGGPVDGYPDIGGLPDIGGPPISGLPSIGAPYYPPPPDEDEDPPPPPDDPPIILPPPPPPSEARYYRPPTDFSSGAPRAQMPGGLSVRSFGQAPGFEPFRPPPIVVPPKLPKPPSRPRPPRDDIRLPPPDDFLRKATGMSHGGILRLPQSQQGDIMTTRIFQNAFKPRR